MALCGEFYWTWLWICCKIDYETKELKNEIKKERMSKWINKQFSAYMFYAYWSVETKNKFRLYLIIQATSTSFHILSNSLDTNNSTIRNYVYKDWYNR
jgi:hypothetical protein